LAKVTLFLLLVPLTHLPSFLLFPSTTKTSTRRRDDDDENDENCAGSLGHGRVNASGPAAVRSLLFAKNVHFPLIIPRFVSLHVLLLQKQGALRACRALLCNGFKRPFAWKDKSRFWPDYNRFQKKSVFLVVHFGWIGL
jgi:hypothetical protein